MTKSWKLLPPVGAVGVGLTAVALFLATGGAGRGLQQPTPDAPPPPVGGAVTVLGTVASDPPETPVGPPALAALVTVEKVLVAEGQAVTAGTPLEQFDAPLVRDKLPQAEAELAASRELVAQAEAQRAGHSLKVEGQELSIRTLKAHLAEGEAATKIARDQFARVLATPDLNGKLRTQAEKATERSENLDLRKASNALVNLRAKVAGEDLALKGLHLTPVESDVRAAAAKVARLEATVAEARAALDAYTLKARCAGVIERVYATPGQTFGPATRTPVLWLIPEGKRTVRAEVEPEFAPRVVGREGARVTIIDGSNFAATYSGIVRRVGQSFLPKRSQADSLALAPTPVLECLIDVADPAPPGKPALRVGQPVRVTFP